MGATDEIDLTATAIDINGTMDVSGALTGTTATLTTADNLTQLTLKSTDTDANVGPRMDLTRDSSSPAASDSLGQIRFMGEDAGDNSISYAHMTSFIVDPTDGSEDGKFEIDVRKAGTQRSRLLLDENETVFNQESQDLDFRVESDANTHMLFVDAGNSRIGLGESSPSYTLDLDSSSTNAFRIRGASNTELFSYSDSSGVGWATGTSTSYGELLYLDEGSSRIIMYAGGDATTFFTSAATIVNDGSRDHDFRVESDSLTHALFVDAGNDVVNIGGTTVEDGDAFSIHGSGTNTVARMYNTNTGADGCIFIFQKASSSPADSDVLGDIRFHGNDSAGSMTQYGRIIAFSEERYQRHRRRSN